MVKNDNSDKKMKLFLLTAIIFFSTLSSAQDIQNKQFYQKNKSIYSFSFQDTLAQSLEIDTLFSASLWGVKIKIFNNSNDTIKILYHKPQDQPIMWLHENLNPIPPGSAFVLECIYGHHRPGPFHNTIKIKYLQKDTIKSLQIPTRGFAIVNGKRPWLRSE